LKEKKKVNNKLQKSREEVLSNDNQFHHFCHEIPIPKTSQFKTVILTKTVEFLHHIYVSKFM